jgi:hypothetical protein
MEGEKPRKYIKRTNLLRKGYGIKKIVAPKERTPYEMAKKRAVVSKYVRNQRKDTDSYLRYFGFVKTYISVKHDISKEDLDVLLYLHNEDYFSYDYFYALVRFLDDKNRNQFKKYVLRGYIVKVQANLKFAKAAPKVVDTSLYKMSTQAKTIIRKFYDNLTKLIEIDANSQYIHLIPEEAQEIINQFQREILNISSKRQKPDRIVPPSVKVDGRKKVSKID